MLSNPQIHSFARHMVGTYPFWFDPSYWLDTIYPQIYLKGHVLQALHSMKMLFIFLFDHPEAFLLGFVLLLAGARFPRTRSTWAPFFAGYGLGSGDGRDLFPPRPRRALHHLQLLIYRDSFAGAPGQA